MTKKAASAKMLTVEKKKQKRMIRSLRITAVILFWIAVWHTVSIIVNQPLYVPSPVETFKTLGALIITSEFWLSVGATFVRVAAGLVISFIAGVSLAFAAAHFSLLETILRPAVSAIKSTPVMSVVILALVWFSSSFVPVFSCILLCFPIFYANTITGIKSVETNYLELAKVYRIRRVRTIKEVTIPSVLPHVYAALSICLGFSWKSVVAAEVLSSPKYSMGYNMYATKLYLNTTDLFAWTIAIIIISIIVERRLKRLLPMKGSAL